jgi:hypothetical protein
MQSIDIKSKLSSVVLSSALLLTLWPNRAVSQQEQQQPQQTNQTDTPSQHQEQKPDEKNADSANAKPGTNQAMSPEEARQAQFLADSQKLYQLAQELKVEVAKSDKNTLSISVTKKAEEIEKLAKSLKERMRKE